MDLDGNSKFLTQIAMEFLTSLNSKRQLKILTFDFIQKMLRIYSRLLIRMETVLYSTKNSLEPLLDRCLDSDMNLCSKHLDDLINTTKDK